MGINMEFVALIVAALGLGAGVKAFLEGQEMKKDLEVMAEQLDLVSASLADKLDKDAKKEAAANFVSG